MDTAIIRVDVNGAVTTRTGWTAPANMTFDEWCETGKQLMTMNESINWWLGDWLNEGEARYGETYTQALEVTGHKQDHLIKCKQVAKGVKKWMRIQDLSWTHHRHVADLDEVAQREFLALAHKHDMPSRELLTAVKAYKMALQGDKMTGDMIAPMPSLPVMLETDYTEDNDTYTPMLILDAATKVLSFIELDPASDATAQQMVQAEQWFGVDDGALTRNWNGRVFLHPPHNTADITAFTQKLMAEFDSGRVDEAIAFVPVRSGYVWFQELLERFPVCLHANPLKVWGPSVDSHPKVMHFASFYFGKYASFFQSNFRDLGVVAKAL